MVRFPAVLALCFVSVSSYGQRVHLSGVAQPDRPFARELGRGLVLVITTSAIEVHAAPYKPDSANYADCATSPARGPRPIDFEAWHFHPTVSQRGASPGRHREFEFTLSAQGNAVECKELERVMRSDQAGNDAPEPDNFKAPQLGSGELTILDVELSQPESGREAEIHSLKFVADITLPPQKRKGGRD